MNTDDIIKLAREAGFQTGSRDCGDGLNTYPVVQAVSEHNFLHELSRFAALATQAERESRQVAQAENEQLKARLARSGVELREAVRDEREACAKVGDKFEKASQHKMQRNLAKWIAAEIRARSARSIHDCKGCDCADNDPCKRTAPGLALESGEFVPASEIAYHPV